MNLLIGTTSVDLSTPAVMTIINATPDSFYAGSRTMSAEAIARRAEQALADGAAILDVGGYSSRPGAEEITPDEELRRITLAMESIRRRFPEVPVSIDSFRSEVIETTIQRFGPCIINDITGAADPSMADVAARYNVPLIVMHMRGTPGTMQRLTEYADFINDLHSYFAARLRGLQAAGVRQIIMDPGFGFSKTLDQNFRLLDQLRQLFADWDRPILAGISRKSMIYKTLDTTPSDALTGTTALHWECLRQGASILRVHDTREALQVVALYNRFVSANSSKL